MQLSSVFEFNLTLGYSAVLMRSYCWFVGKGVFRRLDVQDEVVVQNQVLMILAVRECFYFLTIAWSILESCDWHPFMICSTSYSLCVHHVLFYKDRYLQDVLLRTFHVHPSPLITRIIGVLNLKALWLVSDKFMGLWTECDHSVFLILFKWLLTVSTLTLQCLQGFPKSQNNLVIQLLK